jgi:hypothetical protein
MGIEVRRLTESTIFAEKDQMTIEEKYIEIFLTPIRKCKEYKPKFGESRSSEGVSLGDLIKIYGEDPFYSWIGLDSSLMYAAHKAA